MDQNKGNVQSKFKKFFKNIAIEADTKKKVMDKNSLIKKEQKDIIEEYQLIGEKLFGFYKSGANVGEAFEDNCQIILEKLNKIQEYQNEIENIKEEKEIRKSVLETECETKAVESNEEEDNEIETIALKPETVPQNNEIQQELELTKEEKVEMPETVEISQNQQIKEVQEVEEVKEEEEIEQVTEEVEIKKEVSLDKKSEKKEVGNYCSKCGKKNAGDANFCEACGNKLN